MLGAADDLSVWLDADQVKTALCSQAGEPALTQQQPRTEATDLLSLAQTSNQSWCRIYGTEMSRSVECATKHCAEKPCSSGPSA
jgi:hypothetical protein